MNRFDVLLVLGYFRSATAYLSIIRYLSPELRVGLLVVDTDPSLRQKTGQAENLFLRLCQEFGAHIVYVGGTVSTRLMVVQQFPYTDAQASAINASVTAARRAALMTLAMAGVEKFDHFMEQFAIERAYVPSRRFMSFLLERRNAGTRYRDVEVEEVGLPFGAYPVFPDFGVDWLVAAPTLFSFSTEAGKQVFLECILKLMSQMEDDDVVAYKPHNGNELDYFAPRGYYVLASAFMQVPGGERVLRVLSRAPTGNIRRFFSRTLTSALHQKVLRRAMPLIRLTPYADISLEAFLPGVRKGVIGGLSNTIWGTLYFRRPFFNCADSAMVHHGESELLQKASETLLKLNLEYFGVPYCAGDLGRGATGDDIVLDSDRTGDLLRAIRRDLDFVS